MLVSFSVSNFRSFGEEVTLTMVASNRYSDHQAHVMRLPSSDRSVVRTAVIYGANAAGKSNLVKAMARVQDAVRGELDVSAAADTHAFQAEPVSEPSSFEFRFVAAERIFAYGFDAGGSSIRAEWLSVVLEDKEEVLFERDANGRTTVIDRTLERRFSHDSLIRPLLKSLADSDLNDSQLFLNRIHEVRPTSQGPVMQAVLEWLTRSLVIIPADRSHENVLRRLSRDPGYVDFAARILEQMGTGVHRLELQQRSQRIPEEFRETFDHAAEILSGDPDSDTAYVRDPQARDRILVRRLVACHRRDGKEYKLPFGDESDGTRRLLGLLPVLEEGRAGPRVFVVDELDRSLHPLLCWEFLRLFADTMPEARRQLVVTTHEAHLLNQELLRRDEYWFMEKDETQQSRLVPLSDYQSVRKDLKLEKGYLSGRFGAVPIIGRIDDLEELLTRSGKESASDASQDAPA